MLGGFLGGPLKSEHPTRRVKDRQVPAKAKLNRHNSGAFKCCRGAQWHPARDNDHAAILAKREMCVRVDLRGGIPRARWCVCAV